MGVNPVQIEIGEFDEAIDAAEEEEEEVTTESEFSKRHIVTLIKFIQFSQTLCDMF